MTVFSLESNLFESKSKYTGPNRAIPVACLCIWNETRRFWNVLRKRHWNGRTNGRTCGRQTRHNYKEKLAYIVLLTCCMIHLNVSAALARFNTAIYLYKLSRPDVFSLGNQHKCLSKLFQLHLNTLCYHVSTATRNIFSADIDFRRQNLASIDVRLWRLKSIPAL